MGLHASERARNKESLIGVSLRPGQARVEILQICQNGARLELQFSACVGLWQPAIILQLLTEIIIIYNLAIYYLIKAIKPINTYPLCSITA